MTVFVIHPIMDNIVKATAFGRFQFVNTRYVYGDEFEPASDGRQMLPHEFWKPIVEAAASYNPHNDYLLLHGDMVQLSAFVGVALGLHRSISVLRYDKKIADYIPVKLHSVLADPRPLVLKSDPLNTGATDAQAGNQEERTRDIERTIEADRIAAEIDCRRKS